MTFKYSDFNQNRVVEQNHSIGFGSTKIAHISRAALHAGSCSTIHLSNHIDGTGKYWSDLLQPQDL